MRDILRGLICHEEFHHHLTRIGRASIVGGDDHPFGGFANAGGREGPLAFDLHHTGAAVAVGAIARLRLVAQMRDLETATIGDFPDGQASLGRDLFAIQRKCNLL